MILKQKAFQKLAQIMKLKENQEKKNHIPVSNPNLTKTLCAWSGTVQRRYHSVTLPSISEVLLLIQYK